MEKLFSEQDCVMSSPQAAGLSTLHFDAESPDQLAWLTEREQASTLLRMQVEFMSVLVVILKTVLFVHGTVFSSLGLCIPSHNNGLYEIIACLAGFSLNC